MWYVRLAGDHLEMAVRLVVAGDVFDYLILCCPFSQDMSWMRSENKLSQFLRIAN